jgi:DNA polymerase I-like protein with 3'-5' exonuclease and polymerase domains
MLSERATKTGDLYFQPNLEIHDDLTFILPTKGIDDYVEKITTDMLKVDFDFINVPLTVEVAMGENLLEMQEVLVASSDTWGK